MIILRSCVASTCWRMLGQKLTKPIVRTQTTSPFSNIKTSFTQNVLIFEHKDRILPVLGVIGLLQFIALDAVAYWSFFLFGTVTAKQENLTSDSSLLERAATIVPTKRFRYVTNGLIVLLSKQKKNIIIVSSFFCYCYLGGAIFGACLIYPARCIRRLYLLKDGSSVGIVTYGLWSSARKFTVPLENVSAQVSIKGVGIFHKLHIRNRWFSHVLNVREGKFYNKDLYETVIALKRF